MNNLKIHISAEYEDDYGGHGNWEDAVTGDITNVDQLVERGIEALGRMGRQIETFREQPLPEDERPQTDSEAYDLAH